MPEPEEAISDLVRILRMIEAIAEIGHELKNLMTAELMFTLAVWRSDGRPPHVGEKDSPFSTEVIAEIRPRVDKIADRCLDVWCLVEPFLTATVEAGGELPEGVPFVN